MNDDDTTPPADDPGNEESSREEFVVDSSELDEDGESADPGRSLFGLHVPGRADVMSALGRLVWVSRNNRTQRLAGKASAEHAVKIESGSGADTLPDDVRVPQTPAAPDEPGAEELATEEAPDEFANEPFVADPKVAAFFDVDNTLIQGASIILLARGLAKHKFFTARDVLGLAWSQAKFRISGEENKDDVEAGKAKALAFVEGRTVAELTALSEDVVDTSMLDRVWPGTRALVQMHLDAGQQVWLVTATPLMLARVIATRLGLSGALGTVTEEVDGVYTGRLVGDILHGPGKAHAIATLAEAEGFDLSRCYAYSDSFNDMPMLTMVGHPVAINPDSKLRKYASENGWNIKDFRTVRKAAKKAVPGVLAVGGIAGAGAAVRSRLGTRTD
ncbi:hypothetical protein NCCP2495_13880 [Dietzia sp. NCCP-2495]|uniref:HAD family hydrolase n=1 Tax=Dietzia sp. NCCP-2495 TaxID=2934675 RepID=UPI00280E64D7|nr:hypothetical protein NCCP2495_13880 [Dietzia sp. NCCP-2495]